MRKIPGWTLTLGLIALVPLAASAAETPREVGVAVQDGTHYVSDEVRDQLEYIGDDLPAPWFYVQAEAMILRRELTNTNFPATSQGVAGPILAQLQNLAFKDESGLKLTIGRR